MRDKVKLLDHFRIFNIQITGVPERMTEKNREEETIINVSFLNFPELKDISFHKRGSFMGPG